MENRIGENVKEYRNVVIRASQIGNDTILADDAFITDSIIGEHCTIERRGMIFNSSIADYSYTGYNTVVKYAEIGKFCSISWNVSIGGANHNYHRLSTHPFSFIKKYGFAESGGGYSSFENPLIIGNDVWIGCNSVILRGIHIGNGAVIGAAAVVTKDIPPYAIVVGNPAKVIKYRFSEQLIEKLQVMKWWDWPKDFLQDHLSYFQKEDISLCLLEEIEEKYQAFLNERG